jgi:outer membrane lipoprotein-sorting protein
MMRIKLLLAISLFSITTTFAQTLKPAANPDRILAELRKTSLATNTIQASFSEEKYLAVLKEPEKSSGEFFYKRKDKMRWEQKLPAKYIILINGDKMRIQEGSKERNIGQAGRMASQIKELMIGLVNGDFQENKSFSQQYFENADQFVIEPTPVNRRIKNIYSKISLNFSKSSSRLKELVFLEKGGDKNIMKFHSEKVNQPINDSLFQNL